MDDIELQILDAWRKIKPRLLQNPAELKRRLARRQSRSLTRPPRAWCLAIRASDRRIAEFQNDWQLTTDNYQLFVDVHVLRHLCRPITIQSGGNTWDAVAKQLGTGFTGLHNARISGRLRTRYVQHLGGRPGPAVPLLSCEEDLDPNARGFAVPDPAWSWTAQYLTHRIPDDFQTCLTRVPIFRSVVGRRRFDNTLHPEVKDAPRNGSRPRLPPPPPDYVHYQMKDDVLVPDEIEQFLQAKRARENARHTAWRRRNPRPSQAGGSLQFRGWMWICPKCNKKVRTLYLPLPPVNLLEQLPTKSAVEFTLTTNNYQLTTFACHSCHRIRSFSRIDTKNSWNELVSYLTGGLLYGREVEKPEWYDRDAMRKRDYRPRANRPAPRRQQVLRRMLNGWTITQIATDLKMCKQQVCDSIRHLCRQENVANRRELAIKLGSPHFQPMDSDRVHCRDAAVAQVLP